MADFCNICAPKMGFEEDFNIENIYNDLDEGYYRNVLCEGCGLAAIAKIKEEIRLTISYPVEWLSERDFFKKHGKYITN